MRSATGAGNAEVEHNRDANTFIKWLLEGDKAAIDGQLTHPGADLASIFENDKGENRAAKFDARAPLSFLYGCSRGHSSASITPAGDRGQITKVREKVGPDFTRGRMVWSPFFGLVRFWGACDNASPILVGEKVSALPEED